MFRVYDEIRPVDGCTWANRPCKDADLTIGAAEAMRKALEADCPPNKPPVLIRCDNPEAAVMLAKHGFTPLVHPDKWDETVALFKAEGMWEE